MAAQDPQSLLSAASCYQCYGVGNQLQLMQLALLQQILLNQNPSAMTDPQSLLTQAKCFECYGSSPYMLMLMELALLSQIAGAGLGNGQIVEYFTTTPTADGVLPNNQNAPAIAVKPGSTTYTWDPVGHTWT